MIKNTLFALWNDTYMRNLSITTITLLGLLVAYIFWARSVLPPELPLYFSLASPSEQLAARQDLIGLPIILSGIVLGNMLLSVMFYSTQKILSKILIIISILVIILMFITLLKITLLIV